MEDALTLARLAETVTIVHRADSFSASTIMAERVKKEPKIDVLYNSVIEDILDPEQESVTSVKIKNLKNGEVSELAVDGVFIAIGHQPNTSMFKGQLDLTEDGHILTDGVKTSAKGVFAAGDVMDRRYKQAIVAAGNGSAAALEAQWYLEDAQAPEGK